MKNEQQQKQAFWMTETRNPNTLNIDDLDTIEILEKINLEDQKIPFIIKNYLNDLVKIIEQVVITLQNDGRIIYLGAGTSATIAILDALELPPTFGLSKDKFIPITTFNKLNTTKQNIEDDKLIVLKALKEINLNDHDLVIAISASGSTPFVMEGLKYAKKVKAITVAFSNNKKSLMSNYGDYILEIETGEEVITGSTRMKAWTSQKLVLNMISTTAMIKLGKVYENLMIDMKPSNTKLQERAKTTVSTICDVNRYVAEQALIKTDWNIRYAIIMLIKKLNLEEIETLVKKEPYLNKIID